MALSPLLVSIQDVKDAYEGEISPERETWVMTQVGRAIRLLNRRAPGLAARVDAEAVDRGFVADVIVEAVLRVVRNPEGIYREQEDSYGYSKSVDVASGRLEFTADELASLKPPTTRTVGSIPLVVPDWRRDCW